MTYYLFLLCCAIVGYKIGKALRAAAHRRSVRVARDAATVAEMKARRRPRVPSCAHAGVVDVELSTGEIVAWWCPDCSTQFETRPAPPGSVSQGRDTYEAKVRRNQERVAMIQSLALADDE